MCYPRCPNRTCGAVAPRRKALLGFTALLALPLQAQAQTVTTLVSNTGQADSGSRTVGGNDFAQPFGTGSNSGGYNLDSIVLDFNAAPTGTATLTVTVRENSSGDPSGTVLYTLTNPTVSAGLNEFSAPANATLDANATYWVVASYSASNGGPSWWRTLVSNGIDTGAAMGWTIDGPYEQDSRVNPDGWTVGSSGRSVQIAVKGSAIGGTTTSSDATLSALTVNDGTTDHTIDLASTPYTLDVGNAVTTVTLTATPTDTGASVSAVTLGGTAIADRDFTDGITVPSLAEGDNVIVVTVTAEDGTKETHTVTVTRAALLPPPPGDCASGAVWCTTMSVGSVLDGSGRGFRSSMDYEVGPAGALDSDSFTTDSVDYRVKQLYVSQAGYFEFELSAGLSSYAAHTLEIAGESLPLTEADYVDPARQVFSFAPSWMVTNAPSLDLNNYRTTLPVGIRVPVCLRTGTQVCPAVDTATDLTDASLNTLSLSDGNGIWVPQTPMFASETTEYTASVGNEIGTARLFATTTNENATIVLAFGSRANRPVGDRVPLNAGLNTVTATVTAENDSTTRVYTVKVTRALPPPPPPAPSNCEADAIWCTAMTVGEVSDEGYINPTGYCGPGATISDDCSYGSVSDDDFTLGQTDYTVESVRWDGEESRAWDVTALTPYMNLTLDGDLPDSSLVGLTLRVGTHAFALADAIKESVANNFRFRNNYDWMMNASPNLGVNETITVQLLGAQIQAVPGAPTSLTATASGTTTINLSWTAPSSDGGSAITGYRIEVSPNGTSSWTNREANTDTTTTTYSHTGLSAGTTRHYRVSAINSVGTGTASNVDNATTPTVPGAPTGLTATASGTTTIDLSWTAPASDGGSAITGYKIEVSSDGGSSWTDREANTDTTTTTYSHTGLDAGTTRHYRVSAINANGTGTASNVGNATTLSTDATLSTLTVNDGTTDHTIDLVTTPYTLDVGNAVTTVTLTATPTHTGASVVGVTLGGTAIADTVFTDGITVPSLAEGDNVIVVTVTAEDATTMKTYTVTVTRAGTTTTPTTETEVPANWALKPSVLSGGDKFRLLFITSTTRNAVPTAIADYNTFVQNRAAAGDTAIQSYSSGFRAVGSTEDVDARDNTPRPRTRRATRAFPSTGSTATRWSTTTRTSTTGPGTTRSI